DRNQPDVVVSNLVARIAALYPDLVADGSLLDAKDSPQRQLEKLLVAVSLSLMAQPEALRVQPGALGAQPEAPGQRESSGRGTGPLVLLVDGLDEADSDPDRPRDNPVERILPYRLPPGVAILVASRAWLSTTCLAYKLKPQTSATGSSSNSLGTGWVLSSETSLSVGCPARLPLTEIPRAAAS
ncbi:hypothetical protein ACFL5O_07740, partial [Myxococcota bacterium]